MIDKDKDTLLNIIEKIALIPDNKLVLVEPTYIPCNADQSSADQTTGSAAQGAGGNKVSYMTRPKVKGVLSLPDVFSKLLSNQTV